MSEKKHSKWNYEKSKQCGKKNYLGIIYDNSGHFFDFFYVHVFTERIPGYECDMMEMDWDASYEGKIKFNYTKSFKAVCASVWQTKENEKVLFAYNYSDTKKTIDVGGKKYEIEPKSFFAEKI